MPDLRSALDRIGHADPTWLGGAVCFELLSCAGYTVLFGLVFGMLGRRLTSRLSLSELAVNSVVSVSGLAGIALGAWVLRSKGVSADRIATPLGPDLRADQRRQRRRGGRDRGADVARPVAGLTQGTAHPAAGRGSRWRRSSARLRWPRGLGALPALGVPQGSRRAVALKALADGVADALRMIREHDWRLLGAVGYWLFDNLALYACLAAFGGAPSVWVVAMAYLVGMLANSIPIPAGMIAVEGGLVGMLLLFDVRPASHVVVAVVIYRAISLWLPAVIGSLAFLSLRREIGKPLTSGAPG